MTKDKQKDKNSAQKKRRGTKKHSFYEKVVNFLHPQYALVAEFLVIVILILVLLQTAFMSSFGDIVLNIVVFSLVSFTGAFLVYSVRREVSIREESQEFVNYLREANKKLLELDKLKSEFIYLATHQIRTPLTSIRGYISMILEGDYGEVPDNLYKPLKTSLISSKEMVDTIEYFLNVTRIERGNITYDMKVFDMKTLVKHVSEQMKQVVDRSGLTFYVDIDEEKEYMVYGDPDKLRQVLTNIIDNSIHYTEQGSITVHLWKRDGVIRVEVKDTGIGLSEEDKDRIFTKFGRANDAEKRNVFGAGLGLYIAKEILREHNGRIDAVSEGRGKGSKFFVELKERDKENGVESKKEKIDLSDF